MEMQRWEGAEMESSSSSTILGQVTSLLWASVSPWVACGSAFPTCWGCWEGQTRPVCESRRPVVVRAPLTCMLMPRLLPAQAPRPGEMALSRAGLAPPGLPEEKW